MVLKPAGGQAQEDSSMRDGVFKQYNTTAPKETQVLPLFSSGAGIGLQAFAEAGANVAIWNHGNKEALKRAEEIEERYDMKCKAYQTDVTDYANVKQVINDIAREFDGRLDIFVANAGIPWTKGRMIDGEISDYHKVISTDLDSVYYCAKAAGEIFRHQYETGVSMTGEALQNHRYAAVGIKYGQSGYEAPVPELSSRVGKFARANSISPGYMATEISNFIPPDTKAIWRGKMPMGREGEAHELK